MSSPSPAIVSALRRIAVCSLSLLFGLAPATRAVGVDGAVRLGWTSTELDSSETTGTNHVANLSLEQILTPYLRLRFYGTYGEQTTDLEGDEVASRSALQPAAEIVYRRPQLGWRLGWEAREIDSLVDAEEVDGTALVGSLSWKPQPRLHVGLGFRDATDQGDVAALGRDLEERQGNADVLYQRPFWGIGYSAAYLELAGGLAELEVEQLRHDLRLNASRDFADDRLRVSFAGSAGRSETDERRGEGALGEPLPVIQGLFAVDPSPEVGELASEPELVDGVRSAATTPPIEIGGGNTFRNVGVDLGLPRPASRLEIGVDRESDPRLVWNVYESADGAIWRRVEVVARGFDSGLLLYTLIFAETEQRFLKAVNVTPNAAAEVRVTEVRALRELSGEPALRRERDHYNAGLYASWQAHQRIRIELGAETSNDEATTAGLVRRSFTASGAHAGIQIQLAEDLRLGARYRRDEYEERGPNGLSRMSDDLGAHLRWEPLPTVDAVLSAGHRKDADAAGVLSTLDSGRLIVSLDLLDELRLVTDLGISRIGGSTVEADRETLAWVERIEMQPWERWRVGGGYSWSRTEAAGGVLLDRSSVFVELDWSPGSALALRGSLYYYDEAGRDSLRQTYALFWAPGPKLTLSLGWDQFDEQDGLATANDSVNLNYQATPRMGLFAGLTRSRTAIGVGSEVEVVSAQAGTYLSF